MFAPIKYLTSIPKGKKIIAYFYYPDSFLIIPIESRIIESTLKLTLLTFLNNPNFLGIKLNIFGKQISAYASIYINEDILDFEIELGEAIKLVELTHTNVFMHEEALYKTGVKISEELILDSLN